MNNQRHQTAQNPSPPPSSGGALPEGADIHAHWILVLDFGSQYTQLIARRVREAGVYCEIHCHDIPPGVLYERAPAGIILSGGPESVYGPDRMRPPDEVFSLGVPVLGICYGMQIMAQCLGGEVQCATGRREFGPARMRILDRAGLFAGVQGSGDGGQQALDVWMSHGDHVTGLPPGFTVTGSSDNAPISAMADVQRGLYGVQFHPEVTHTPEGAQIFVRFVRDICRCRALWTPGRIIDDAICRIQATVGQGKVLLALSGGVDSSVVAALLHRAIGERLICLFVDNGLLRLGEGDEIMATLGGQLGIQIRRVDASKRFFAALQGLAEPEEKRKAVGRLFIRIFEETSAELEGVQWLAQGTIYPDVIESAGAATGKAHAIKSHHNVGGLPAQMKLKLVEPLRSLFKDEVRAIGLELGLPRELVYRHPFPGPGLSVRVLGEVRQEYVERLRLADDIFLTELKAHDLYHKVSQAFAVYLPVRSVGVMGDMRRYEHVIALRAVETVDFMTARWARLPFDFLERVANRIINELTGISRVTYDISGKPPATIEWE